MPRKKKVASAAKIAKPAAAKPAAPSSPSKSRVTANRAAFRAHVRELLPAYGGNHGEALLAAIADFTDPEIREMVMGGDMEEEVEEVESEEEEADEGADDEGLGDAPEDEDEPEA